MYKYKKGGALLVTLNRSMYGLKVPASTPWEKEGASWERVRVERKVL